jgi:hypothetical protein
MCQILKAVTNQSREDALTICKVMIRRLMRAPSTTRDLPHAQGSWPAFIEQVQAGRQQILPPVATGTRLRPTKLFLLLCILEHSANLLHCLDAVYLRGVHY